MYQEMFQRDIQLLQDYSGLTYKQRDATLKGQGYASPVKFWMPFNGGIGFHDASWRNTFGGTI